MFVIEWLKKLLNQWIWSHLKCKYACTYDVRVQWKYAKHWRITISTSIFCLHVSLGDVRGRTCPYVLANLAFRGSIKLGILHKKHERYLALNISEVNTWQYTCKKSWLMPEVAIRIPNSEELRLVSRMRGAVRITVEVNRCTKKRTQETRLTRN